MRHRRGLMLGLFAVVGLLAALGGQATANRLSLSNQSFRIMYREYSSNNGAVEIICSLTLEGSFHSRTLAKVRGGLIGYVTRAGTTHPCSGGYGDMTFLSETLPWHVHYLSFTGTLPRISAVTIDVVGWSWDYPEIGGVGVCLYRSTEAGPARFILNREAGGVVTSVGADPGITVPKFRGGILCAETINYRGTGSLSLLGTTTPIRITLI